MLHRLSRPQRCTGTGRIAIIVDDVVWGPRARPELARDEANVEEPRARPKLEPAERWWLLFNMLEKSCEAQAPRERTVQHVEPHKLRLFSKLSDDGADVARSAEKQRQRLNSVRADACMARPSRFDRCARLRYPVNACGKTVSIQASSTIISQFLICCPMKHGCGTTAYT